MAHILVLDDLEMMRDSLDATLSRSGHQVTTCAEGMSALEKVSRCSFDLIITDMKMPKMDG